MPGAETSIALHAELSRAAIGTFAIKIGFALSSLGISILLARVLGPHGYGLYAHAFAWLVLLAQSAMLGVPTLMVREVSALQARGEWDKLGRIIRWSQRFTGVISLIVTIIALGCLLLLEERGSPRLPAFGWALVLLPLLVAAELRNAILRGLHRVFWSQVPDFIVRPLVQGGLLLALLYVAGPLAFTPSVAMALYGVAVLVAFFMSGRLFHYHARHCVGRAEGGSGARHWLASVLPLGVAGILQIVNQQSDILLLGWLASAHEVGLYKVAAQCATVVVFLLDGLNLVLAPQVSRLNVLGDRSGLQRMITLSARFSLTLALPLGGVLMLAGDDILSAVFGEEYRRAHTALAILCAGQIANAAMGSVGLLLNMTGFEKDMMVGLFIATLGNIALDLMLIPSFGLEGAAAAMAVSLVVWNLFMLVCARRRLGIVSLPWTFARRH